MDNAETSDKETGTAGYCSAKQHAEVYAGSSKTHQSTVHVVVTMHHIMQTQMVATRHDWFARNIAFEFMLAFCTDRILGACRFIDMTGQSHNVLNLLLTETCTATSTASYSHCSNP